MPTARCFSWSRTTGLKACATEPQCVSNYRHGAEGHRRAGDHRAEEQAKEWIEHAGSDGDAEDVVDEGEEEVLFDVAHHRLAEVSRAHDAAEISLDQRDAGALNGHVGSGSHGDAH